MFLKAEPLTSAAFLPFGEVIECPAVPGRTYFEDALANLQPNARPEYFADGEDRGGGAWGCARSARCERREFSSQSFIPQEAGRWLVMVTAACGRRRAGHEHARASSAGPMQGMAPSAPNVWHHPFTGSMRRPPVIVRDVARWHQDR